jgi:hypothetical protein
MKGEVHHALELHKYIKLWPSSPRLQAWCWSYEAIGQLSQIIHARSIELGLCQTEDLSEVYSLQTSLVQGSAGQVAPA